MTLSISLAVMDGVKRALGNLGIESAVAERIGSIASYITMAICMDYHSHITSLETDDEVVLHAASHAIAHAIASVENESDNTFNNLDNNKTEEIFSQIDLAQARIAKDQEEIQSLAQETDELLNQLKSKAI